MSLLRCAITGSHGTGKSTIIAELGRRAQDQLEADVITITSPTRYVKSLGFANNLNLDYKTEMMCLVLRVERQKSALLSAEAIVQSGRSCIILADRCCLDELSYTRDAIEEIRQHANPTRSMDLRQSRLQGVYNLFYDWMLEDVNLYWDVLGYKPPHPDFPPEADGDRLGDRTYQFNVDRHILYHFEKLHMSPAPEGSTLETVELDPDMHVATDELWTMIQERVATSV